MQKLHWTVAVLLAMFASNATADFDVPTGAPPSPLFGAQPFTAKIYRFEEFGSRAMPSTCIGTSCPKMPTPLGTGPAECTSQPADSDVEAFLSDFRLYPEPQRMANDGDANPWLTAIRNCVDSEIEHSPAEGRPPGEWYAHQRWPGESNEVYDVAYTRYFKSVTTGARTNRGERDPKQSHEYTYGEFGPGGLYHEVPVVNAPSTDGVPVKFHQKFPEQRPEHLWTFDGTFPPKLFMAEYGEPTLFRHYNGLPIDPGVNGGFGLHQLTTHEHNGHNPAESDGYTQSYFFPGQYYDYRWPMILAGHDTYPAGDPRAAGPTGKLIRGDWRETMSTHWFHDHRLDFTAQNVYKGSAALMNYYSAVDRGVEDVDCVDDGGVNLCLRGPRCGRRGLRGRWWCEPVSTWTAVWKTWIAWTMVV